MHEIDYGHRFCPSTKDIYVGLNNSQICQLTTNVKKLYDAMNGRASASTALLIVFVNSTVRIGVVKTPIKPRDLNI